MGFGPSMTNTSMMPDSENQCVDTCGGSVSPLEKKPVMEDTTLLSGNFCNKKQKDLFMAFSIIHNILKNNIFNLIFWVYNYICAHLNINPRFSRIMPKHSSSVPCSLGEHYWYRTIQSHGIVHFIFKNIQVVQTVGIS